MKQAGIPAFCLAGLCITAATVLQAIGHPSGELWTFGLAIGAGAVGITIPDRGVTATSTAAGSAQAAVDARASHPASQTATSTASSTPTLTSIGTAQ